MKKIKKAVIKDRARIMDQLVIDMEAHEQNGDDQLQQVYGRIMKIVNDNDVDPIKVANRCDATPYGQRCRLNRGHEMPHNIEDGPWPAMEFLPRK